MFNAQAMRQMQNARNTQARLSRFKGGSNQLTFLELRELLDGTYRIRLWPDDPKCNPLGYLHWRTHRLWDCPLQAEVHARRIGADIQAAKDACESFMFQCPRSNNWDPLPIGWEDSNGNPVDPAFVEAHMALLESQPEGQRGELGLFPVYTERCWACELEEQVAELGLDVSKMNERLQWWFNGEKSGQDGILSRDAWHFAITITAEVASTEVGETAEGKKYTKYTYKLNPQSRMAMDLSLEEGAFKRSLMEKIMMVPDCGNAQTGRWLRLTKRNEGKGVGGYELEFEPYPTPVDFQIGKIPNYAGWGAPKPQSFTPKPRRRFSYGEIESRCANSQKWWVGELEALGLVLSDESIPF